MKMCVGVGVGGAVPIGMQNSLFCKQRGKLIAACNEKFIQCSVFLTLLYIYAKHMAQS